MSDADRNDTPLLEALSVVKTYPGVVALHEADLVLRRGEVHALVGENGAGKSTLIKILTGAEQRNSGTVTFAGQPHRFASVDAAQAGGVSAIFQELNLIPYASVAENIFLGRFPRRLGFIDWGNVHAASADLMRRLRVDVDVRAPLYELSASVRQMVAIARAMSQGGQLIIMDEPTSSLDEQETETLFDLIRDLKTQGTSVIFVTHRLDEIYAVCDRITVLRDGETVRSAAETSELPKLDLIAAMLGRDREDVRSQGVTRLGHAQRTLGPAWLEAEGLDDGRRVRDVSLAIPPSGIVGLAGLLGSGRSETARALFGDNPDAEGAIRIDGRAVRLSTPRDAVRAGIGFCTEDRKTEGIIPLLSVRDNLTLALLPRLTRMGVVDRGRQRAIVERYMRRLGVKASSMDQPIGELSGGNQQKVLLARWLCTDPRLLIVDEPTRGIDIGAKAEIQQLILELSDRELAVLMISSELEELIEGADRLVVLREGHSVITLDHDDMTEATVMAAIADAPRADAAKHDP